MSAVFPMDPSQRAMRPAYVRFVRSSREDRDATIKAGHVVEVHSDLALITPPGTRDVVEREVGSWIEHLAFQVREGALQPALADYYRDIYQRWCQGQEIPPAGTPILGWQLLSSTEQQRVIGANILTVEDLADAGHMQTQEIGMGAMAMVSKAKHWIEVGRDQGQASLAMAAIQQKCEDMQREIGSLRQQLEDRAERRPRADKGVARGPRKRNGAEDEVKEVFDVIEPTTDSTGCIP